MSFYYDRVKKRDIMAFLYKKQWKFFIDCDIKKKDSSTKANVSDYTIVKMSKGGNVTV